ncbi:MAG: DNA polymerase III subunit epsilon [Hydrogenophaga sp.]|uniref:3'-5' exonuclease n=1 Tax=Hydrogenophaga sp. TaxID=1904254 RepID=UPI001BBB9D43|nr:3'-5' exonuclease [Hydrogenophaga sp.]MBS3911336.1 DNA polymerase III subunit epsilon [Hydrogenophaga sp.]MDP2162858.1 3'-5' exonuclease [Hydrogenophaga sp.]MDP3474418.1 3'-5' exonuclease [Hydrogenophaga sp.]
MTQASFDFDAPLVPPVEAPSPAARVAAPEPEPATTPDPKVFVAVPQPEAEPAAGLDFEALACTLEQHPDFRVLRRLVPCMDFGPRPGAPVDDNGAGVQRVLVLDTETTGLQHRSDKIIELAMLLVQVDTATGLPFGPVELYEGFEDPGMPIPEVAQQVTGIRDDMVRGQRLDDAQVSSMLARADLVIAHNAGFDRPFVEARFPVFVDKAWACSFMDIDWKAAGAGSSKLSALTQDQGWFYDAHRAQVDCHALLQVLARPVGRDARTGLALLLAAAAAPSFKLRATGSPFESKDLLKERGYRWDAEARVWACTLPTAERLEAELVWLKSEVYGRRSVRLDIEAQDSRVRYANRPGTLSERAL